MKIERYRLLYLCVYKFKVMSYPDMAFLNLSKIQFLSKTIMLRKRDKIYGNQNSDTWYNHRKYG